MASEHTHVHIMEGEFYIINPKLSRVVIYGKFLFGFVTYGQI